VCRLLPAPSGSDGPGAVLDFDLPPEAPHWWDSSAGRRRASGLWTCRKPSSDDRYRTAALTILDRLCSDEFLALARPDWEGILLHGLYHFPKGLEWMNRWRGRSFLCRGAGESLAGRAAAACRVVRIRMAYRMREGLYSDHRTAIELLLVDHFVDLHGADLPWQLSWAIDPAT